MLIRFPLKKINLIPDKSILKNIFLLGILRGGNILIQLLLIPISIQYVSSDYYGFWLTISSMVLWLNIMDFGLSNGLRNKLSVAKVNNDLRLGKAFVSTTYFFLGIIAIVGIIVLGIGSRFINWSKILSVPPALSQSSLFYLLLIVISAFFITFFLKPISAISYSFHKPYIEPFLTFCAAVVNLCALLLLKYIDQTGNIIYLALVFCFTPIIVNAIVSFILFRGLFRDFKPSFSSINFKYVRPLMSLSSKFFIIQIAATIVLTTSNFIISNHYGNEAVTEYNITQRYFSVVLILHGMLLVPYWNLITEAYSTKKRDWLQATMKKLLLISLGFVVLTILMILVSPYVFKLWLGKIVQIPFSLVILFGIYMIAFIYSSVFITFINGTGKVKLPMITAIFTCVFYIPFILLLIDVFNIGMAGIVIASTIWVLVLMPFRIIQYKRLIDFDKPVSIWNS
jgi:O-antigen/teichoic acid export membrane protein